MLALLKLTLTLVAGAALGLFATYLAVAGGPRFGAVHAGPWTTWPRLGALDPDPYARAALARSGDVPLGLAEGLEFTTATDDTGSPLSSNCSYTVSGAMPASRAWTLTLNTPDGYLVDNPAQRSGFTSEEILRDADSGFSIAVSRSARPGNWLPVGNVGRFVLVLRLYDTPLSATVAGVAAPTMPSVARVRCS